MSEEKEGVMRNAMTTRAPGGANKWQENIYTPKWTKFRYISIYFCIFMC